MFLAYFALWIVLNGRITLELVIIGLLISFALTLFSAYLNRRTLREELYRSQFTYRYVGYFLRLTVEIVRAGFSVMGVILSVRHVVEPQLVYFHSDMKDVTRNVVMANSITLTPGTITVGLRGDQFHVHALDRQFLSGLDDNALLSSLQRMEANDAHAD